MAVESNFDGELLKSGSPGAKEEWERLWTYLLYEEDIENLGLDMAKSRLGRACKRVLKNHGCENELDDFIGFVFVKYQKRYNKQVLFKQYDPAKKGVVQFLCSGTYIYWVFQEYCKEVGIPIYNPIGLYPLDSGDSDLDSPEPDNSESDDQPMAPDPAPDYSEPDGQPIEEYLSRLIKQVFLMKKEGRCREQAGLQLYPRLVKEEEEYRDILNQVVSLVSKAQYATMDQSKESIEREHKEAHKNLEKKRLELDDEIRKLNKKKNKLIQEKSECEKQVVDLVLRMADKELIDKKKMEIESKNEDIKRKNESIEDTYWKSSDCGFCKLFAPLPGEAIVKLCNFKPCSARTNISRYKKLIKELIVHTAGTERLNSQL